MRIVIALAALAVLASASISMADVSYSGGNSYVQANFGVYSGGYDEGVDNKTVSGFPTSWSDSVFVQSTVKTAVLANAAMNVAFGPAGFSGSGTGSAESTTSIGDTSNGTCNVAFYFTLDQAYDYVLNGSFELNNVASSGVLRLYRIEGVTWNSLVDQTLFDPGTLNFDGTTGTLDAGTYHFEAYTEAHSSEWGSAATNYSFDMTFTSAVPEPVSVAAGLFGLALIAARRRR
jgi:MYXO-CTERM domain-containing protein